MKKLYDAVMPHEVIYSLLYSPQRIGYPIEDEIVEIKTSKLVWDPGKETFYFRWGWPGPDYNKYTASTYGKGWAFTKEEIVDAWKMEE